MDTNQTANLVDSQKIIDLYISGKNYYQIAKQTFGFESDEAVAKVREIVERAEQEGKLAGEVKPAGPTEAEQEAAKLRTQPAAAEKAKSDAELEASEARKEADLAKAKLGEPNSDEVNSDEQV